MANLLNLKTIFSLTLPILLLLCLYTQMASSQDVVDDDEEYYVLDNPIPNFRSKSRFLANVIKKGTHCDPIKYNICNGVKSSKGTGLLYCCKTHCRNVLGDKNNCGKCGQKCKVGEFCCNGTCTHVGFNKNHCGKCNKKCKAGIQCHYGSCGYA